MTKNKWPMVKLGDVAFITSGGTPKRSVASYFGGDIPWVKISDMRNVTITQTEEFLTEQGVKNSSAKVFPSGTLLISIFATIGKCAILDIDAATNQAVAGIRLKTEEIDTSYLYYYLNQIRPKLENQAKGVAQNNINIKTLKNLSIPLPPLEEQKRIAEILQKAANENSTVQKQIELLSEVTLQEVRALLKKWEVEENIAKKPLVAFGKFQGGMTPSKSNALFWNGNIPWFSTKDLDGTHHKADSLDHVSDEAISQTSLRRTEQAGIAFSVRGMSLAHRLPMAIIPSGSAINQDLKVFLPKEPNKCESLYWLVKAKEQELLSHVSSSAHGTRKLDFNYLQQVYLPDLSNDQHSQISDVVRKIQQLQKWLRRKEGLISELTESLSSRAFRGRL
ncbi:restriction endonuclease subunit S [Corynebacterium glucuronolyticum]